MPFSDFEQAVRSAATMRRIIIDHVQTGLAHPHQSVVRQAQALATEMDVAGLSVDHEAQRPGPRPAPELAGQQLTLALLARGQDFPAIAKQTGMTVNEARAHHRDALVHYGVLTTTHAVALAIARGDLPHDIALQE